MSVMVDSAFAGPRPVHGDLDVAWIHGSPSRRRRTEPPLQVHAYDEHTYVPGHHETSVALYDPWSGLLLTGDTVYPGRLYVQDMPAFSDNLRRMVAFAEAREVPMCSAATSR